jgi:adenylate kinase family enzyme
MVARFCSPSDIRHLPALTPRQPIPDEIIVQLVNERISYDKRPLPSSSRDPPPLPRYILFLKAFPRYQDCHGGFILIHCPNSASQSSALQEVMQKRGSRIHAVVELVCDQDELLSERVSTKLVKHLKHLYCAIFICSFVMFVLTSLRSYLGATFFFLLHSSHGAAGARCQWPLLQHLLRRT